MTELYDTCNHRKCAINKLIILTKIASETFGPADRISEEGVIHIGLKALQSLGVSNDEIAVGTAEIIFGTLHLPLVGDVDDDTTVSTGNGEDSERKSSADTKA